MTIHSQIYKRRFDNEDYGVFPTILSYRMF